ncbi:MAG: transcription-repair coupling factor [Bacteroidales bacterium]|nr:transcription-repair coupling factor [Bacteroidales bacterium]
MLISTQTCALLKDRIAAGENPVCSGLHLSARWFVMNQVVESGLNVVVLPDKESAEYCASDLYSLTEGDIVHFLPDGGKGVEKSNYKSTLGVQRTSAIESIRHNEGEKMFVVTYPDALSEGIPSSDRLSGFIVSEGMEISFDRIKDVLSDNGFEKVDFVAYPGQFSIRGSIIDIFSYSFNLPYRLSFFGNEVESIHIFDCNTQLSKEQVGSLEIINSVSLNMDESGAGSVPSIFPSGTTIWLDSSDLYKEKEFFEELSGFRRVFFDKPLEHDGDCTVNFNISPQPLFNKNFELLAADIRGKIESGYKVYIFSEREAQTERLKSILIENKGLVPDFVQGKNIHSGFIDNECRICCYSDHEIFDRFQRVSLRRTVEKSEQLTVNDLAAFNIGDYIVHIDHGVGVFGGLVRMKDDKGRMHEVVKLMYKDGDVVFVSVHALHKISRFRSKDGVPPKINKLGSKTWQTLKVSAKSRIKDIAKELIQLYAKRKASSGYAFSPDGYLQEELESSFEFEDTPDQESATRAVKQDMEAESPMDRLICGDVGFGKTEIAVRAAFKAVVDGKQVAVLVPTTILALQHYNTFVSRLRNFPCSIEYVSRLRTAKEISEIKKNLIAGKTDILIGTHKILGKGFEFKDIGLLIIDEEQKFGVSAKEKLRQLKSSIDTLTLSATPIPRTLQFSLLGARDLSIINTPPPNRIPTQTEIILFNAEEIRSIINYELNRGGQVFFLHNKVEELPAIHDLLSRLVPDMKICIAHGQMESSELEDKILSFMRGDYDLLLCTTIIENGLDIPNANTIIINQAQNIGLSDLHQLRGRVGRSDRKGFCYLIVPPMTTLTDDARRRLKAIEEFSDLGSGFNIAMQDLDIRGAGNLLGAEQSGFIMDMGYEAYQKILSEAMEELGVETGISTRNTSDSFFVDCTVDTDQPAMIPDSYIDVVAEKIRIYKQLDSMVNEKEIDSEKVKLEDRFGPMPEEVQNLFTVVKIRNLGGKLGFEKIIIKNGMLIMFFIANKMSPYYKSKEFSYILDRINVHDRLFNLKQPDGRLKIVSRGVDSLDKAFRTISIFNRHKV